MSRPDEEKSEAKTPESSGTGESPKANPWDPRQFPDGGTKAWCNVVGSFCCLVCSFGWINCIGIFQDYYQANQLRHYSASDIAWIASLELFIMMAGGLVVGRIYDNHGPRGLLIAGTFLHVFGLMMTSISNNYYQILLAQGVCSPLGISCIFTPATVSVTTWFHKRRAFVLGIVAAGSSIGGVIFPIMLDHLIVEVGFGWAMRICAFLILALLVVGCFTVRPRIPPMKRPFQLEPYRKAFTERKFIITTIAAVFFYLGLFLPINYVQYIAVEQGMTSRLAKYLIPILNGASLLGRVLPGYVADRIGHYNTNIIMCAFSGIIVLALWLPGHGNTPKFVFSILYGFSSGGFVSLIPAIIAQISDMREIGLRVGLEFGILSVSALISNPIGGAFITHGFSAMKIWTGVVLLTGCIFFIVARTHLVGMKVMVKV